MTFEIEGGLVVSVFKGTCCVVNSPKATGTVVVPKFAEIEGQKYAIRCINEFSFCGNKIDLLTFPEDSEVVSFEDNALSNTFIKKLKIPPSLRDINASCFRNLQGLTDIEVSPGNQFFKYLDNSYLLKKSNGSEQFDTLIFVRYNIEDVLVPSQVSVIESYSFSFRKQLKTVTFSEDSNLKCIKSFAFCCSTIKKLFLPANIDKIEKDGFSDVYDLTDIEVSPKNVNFSVIDNKYLVKKSSENSQIFDVLVFARRDLKCAVIPSQIKIISDKAFQHCSQLESISFEPNSSLETIEHNAFDNIVGIEKIVFPSSLKRIKAASIKNMANLKTVVILSNEIMIDLNGFHSCFNIACIALPNANVITLEGMVFHNIRKDAKLWVKHDAKILAFLNLYGQYLNYIENDDISEYIESLCKDSSNE